MSQSYLELKNIKKIYPNGFQAIFNLNLKIKEKEFIVFVGPSGCGKSTTIRMIAGLENVSDGEIFLKGKKITDLPTRKRNISMVFQNYALFPHLSTKENIAFTLKTKRAPYEIIEKKVKWAAEILKLSYLLNRKPAQLSGGQRQRVALGRAIVAEPTLFLMDEPLSNLDAKLRNKMRTKIRKLHNDLNTTSIYVTHDQVEAMTMGDRIIVMSDGFIQQIGKPENVFSIPANKFVAEFIGTPQINIIDGLISNKKIVTNIGTIEFSKKLLREKLSKNIQLGFRPQYINILTNRTANSLKCKVSMIEVLGAETIVYTFEKIKIVVKTDQKPNLNQVIYVKPHSDKIILFNKQTGLSLTNAINKETLKSLEIFNKSQSLIEARTTLLEKQKNKKNDNSLFQKIQNYIKQSIFPQFILLNPDYQNLKANIRKNKILIIDARRRKDLKNLKNLLTLNKKYKHDLAKCKKALYSRKKTVQKFNTIFNKINKLVASLSQNKNKEIFQNYLQLKKQGDLIRTDYRKADEYDFKKVDEFLKTYEKIRK